VFKAIYIPPHLSFPKGPTLKKLSASDHRHEKSSMLISPTSSDPFEFVQRVMERVVALRAQGRSRVIDVSIGANVLASAMPG
jgi:hypothetical protein